MTNVSAYSIADVAVITGGVCFDKPGSNPLIRFLLCDSRQLLQPESTLFFALKTKSNDGHLYIPELLEKGVKAFVVEYIRDEWAQSRPEVSFIVHSAPIKALQKIAAHHRSLHTIPVIAITGSNGKTIVKEWLHQLLFKHKHIVRNPKSYNSQIGVPLSVWLIDPKHELGIFEAGISQPGEMDKLQRILNPETGILTNIGSAHDEGFLSREQKLNEKLRLFVTCKTLIYCCDDEFVYKQLSAWKKENPSVNLFAWGRSKNAELTVVNRETAEGHTLVALSYKGNRFIVSIPFQDDASVENALHCIAFMKHNGFEDSEIITNVAQLQTVAMRLEMKEGVNGSTIINDSYNSDLQSLKIALDFLERQTSHQKKTIVLSDILQSGIPAEELYAQVASLLRSKGISRLIGIGQEISSQSESFDASSLFFKTTEDFMSHFDCTEFSNEAILLKGARVFEFERLSNLLQQKDHQTILEINLDALTHNLNVLRSLLARDIRIMGMVKAFSYGSGSAEIARTLQFHNVDYLAVAYADEGKILRQGGVNIPIVVMNPEIRTFETLFAYRLEPEVYGFPLLEKLLKAVNVMKRKHDFQTLPIHIKLDTGMHRLGFLPEEIDSLGAFLIASQGIRVASVFSHLAASEDPRHDDFSVSQIELFKQLCVQLKNLIGYPFLEHISNSSAISRFPGAHFDMVRAGIGLYGVTGDPKVQQLLQHVSTFRSVVSQVKKIRKGSSIGYGRNVFTEGDLEVAIVPVGYADGLNRSLGNGRGKLIVKGKKVPTIGNISMDMCAIDVSGIGVKEGDEVIIFGKEQPVTEIADALGTIPYEVFTSVSQRVKRVYYQG
jgi:Alr-MurF fusion protein